MPAGEGDQAAIAAFLREHTEIVEAMFTQVNLRLVGYSYRIHCDSFYSYAVELIYEVAAVNGTRLAVSEDQCGVMIKANLYDEAGSIIDTAEKAIYSDNFEGYDTDTMHFFTDGVALAADKVRIFAVKW
ncbi:MAG: hypothetical protein JRD89_11655 [Deltaproteobacteria bacterium]|nr:hypothetical protein [Deltaproteobacteria bacterium]